MKKSNNNSLDVPIIFEPAKTRKGRFDCISFFNLQFMELKFLHYHNVLEIGRCIEGKGKCYINDTVTPFEKDYIQIVLPFQPHYDISETPNTYWNFVNIEFMKIASENLNINPGFIMKLLENAGISGVFSPDKYPKLTSLVNEIVALSRLDKSDGYVEDLLVLNTVSLLIELARINDKIVSVLKDSNSPAILPAIQLVSKMINANRTITTKEMAAACFLSESYFRKIFVETIGEPPSSYVQRLQLLKASQLLLSSDKSIFEIMTLCGETEPSTFFRRFKKHFGVSPSEYRKINLEKEIKDEA